jgi:hypothetical protein
MELQHRQQTTGTHYGALESTANNCSKQLQSYTVTTTNAVDVHVYKVHAYVASVPNNSCRSGVHKQL